MDWGMVRLFAAIGARTDQPIRQVWAEPLATGSPELRQTEMGWPRVVVLLAYEDGPMLYRYTASKDFAGDTWHQSLDEAKRSAEFEYGEALGAWEELPEAVAD